MADGIKSFHPTGLYDTDGVMILVGGRVRGDTSSPEFHGEWVEYRVKLQGLTPILSYLTSEKGQVLKEGYTAGILANEYDHKDFVFSEDLSELRPSDRELRYLGE